MEDARPNAEDRSFESNGTVVPFFDTPFLRENLDDLTLALGLGRPVFLLGAAGSGKSMLADEVAHELARRYGVARIEGRSDLGMDEVVAACHRGFAADAWNAVALGADETMELGRTGANVLIVDRAEQIPPSLIVQLVAASGGVPGLLPSHRILFVGRDELTDIIETWQMRNHRGAAVVVRVEPWHGDVVVPFLRHCLRAEGLCEPDLLSEPVIREIAAEADGNPGRMVEFARRTLLSAVRDRADPAAPRDVSPVPDVPHTTIVKLAAAEKPPAVVPPEPATTPALALMPVTEMARSHPAMAPRRFIRVGLPVGAVIVAGGLIWLFDRPAVLDLVLPPQVAAAPAAVREPASAVATIAPRAVTPVQSPSPAPPAPVVEAAAEPTSPPADAAPSQPAPASPIQPTAVPPTPVPETPPPAAVPVVQSQVQNTQPPAAPAAAPVTAAAGTPAPAPAPAARPAPAPMAEDDLILRGDDLLANGDFAAARLFYLQAAKTGSAKAATAVARTYDPMVLTRLGVLGAHGDPDKAAEWYRKAVALGDTTAAEPLRRLAPP
jgi:hypothetical protein